jgi:Domain of unknown function (DUF4331)
MAATKLDWSAIGQLASTGRNDEELARGRHIGAAEHRRCDEPLPGLCMGGLKLFRQSNADGARRNMRRACGQAADDATVTEYDPFNGIVVCQHGNHGIGAAGVRHAGGGFRSLRNKRFDLRACPVVDGHIMAGLQQVRRHAGAHVPPSVLIMNVHPSVGENPRGPTIAQPFAPEALYELKIDTNGDAVADIAYRMRFSSSEGGAQVATLRRVDGAEAAATDDGGQAIVEGAPVSTGREARVTEAGDYRFFAGWRSDPSSSTGGRVF